MPKQLRVLIVEDSEDDMFFALQELKRGDYQPEAERVESLKDYAKALDRQVWDLILCDHSLPGFTSLQALELLKNRQYDIPFIILSGVIGEEVAVQAMKSGANDYVMKSSLSRLVPSIDRELREATNRRIRRQAEKALRRSQYDLNDFFEQAPIGLLWTGSDGAVLRVNWAELNMLGHEPHEVLGRYIAEFFVDTDAAEEVLQQLQHKEVVLDFPAQMRCKTGAIKHVCINANSLFEDGRFVRSRWFLTDMTDRLEHERTAAFLGAVVSSSEDAIIGADFSGTIRSWNAGATRMYGYSAKETLGQSIALVMPESRAEEWREMTQHILDGEPVQCYESLRRRQDHETICVSVTLSPIRDNHGRTLGISAIEHDITEKKQEESERLLLIQELSQALANVKTLRGLLPICATCKRIRDDRGYWNKIENYITEHTMAAFSHGICPECQKHMTEEIETTFVDKP